MTEPVADRIVGPRCLQERELSARQFVDCVVAVVCWNPSLANDRSISHGVKRVFERKRRQAHRAVHHRGQAVRRIVGKIDSGSVGILG